MKQHFEPIAPERQRPINRNDHGSQNFYMGLQLRTLVPSASPLSIQLDTAKRLEDAVHLPW